MRPPRPHLICDTNPMCYGSSTALLSITDALDADITALASGVTHEVLGDDPSIHQVLLADTKDPDAVRHAMAGRHWDAAIVVSNQTCIPLYQELGIPVLFVDILYWFGRDKRQPVWHIAERAIAQNFPGVYARSLASPVAPIVVGPLIRRVNAPSPTRAGTMVQIGGGRSRWVRPGVNSDYACQVADWIRAVPELPQPLLLAGGRESIASISSSHLGSAPVVLRSLRHGECVAKIGSASMLVTSPGLNAVFEAIYSDTPLIFLPPQNATQVAQLAVYEAWGLVEPGLNLPALVPTFPRDHFLLSEQELTHAVLDALPQLRTETARRHIVEHLRGQIADIPARRAATLRFKNWLGDPGGPEAARHMAAWWEEQWM